MNSLVRQHFGRQAGAYERHASLQRAVACRLARLCRDLPIPPGPRADLGAGSGQLSRALAQGGLLQLDHCPELLARNPLQPQLEWDLNGGLPPLLRGAGLLASGFALQWLDDPAAQLIHWCRCLAPDGWLALAVPTAGSFPQWRRAAAAAGVACTALDLPDAGRLLGAAAAVGLRVRHGQVLRFSRARHGGRATLKHLRRLGASASRQPALTAGAMRRLLAQWPDDESLTWEVLLLVGQQQLPTTTQP